tara:strand:+ start:17034 stop:18506 length:1473 start_codon:yes stop_codon:yes gene_type:complete
MRNQVISNARQYMFPIALGIATGLYPLFFYYTSNFTLVSSIKQLLFFVGLFLVLPAAIFVFVQFVTRKTNKALWRERLYTFFSVSFFLMFIQICLLAEAKPLYSFLIVLLGVAAAYLLYKFLRKIMALQYILAFIGLFSLVPIVYKQLTYDSDWMKQPDAISQAKFETKPNVYYIQPDGYLNFSEIEKGAYQYKNNDFKQFLEKNRFTLYDDFRSNYTATLPSNASLFTMRHHYNNHGFNLSEVLNGREIVVTKNPVLDIFKNNGYKTYFLPEWPFFLTSFAEMGYDECNFTLEEDVSFVGKGYYKQKDIFEPLQTFMAEEIDQPKYFFLQVFSPGHVEFFEKDTEGIEEERKQYLERLEATNTKLEALINTIVANDPSAIIAILSDHGGYVGFEYMEQIHTKTTNRDLLYSGFSTQMAIRWPEGTKNFYTDQLKTNVNFFRVLFSHLANNPAYLEHLEEDASFVTIQKGAAKGVYKCIDDDGTIVFEKL